MDEQEDRIDPTIASLDSVLSNIVGRLSHVLDDLNAGIYGNSNECKESSPQEMESASIASIQRRADLAQSHLSYRFFYFS